MAVTVDLWNYVLSPSSTPWDINFGDPSIVNPNLIITPDDVANRENVLLSGSWTASMTITPIIPPADAQSLAVGFGPFTQAVFSPYCPGFYSDGISGGVIGFGGVQFGNAPGIFIFGTLNNLTTHVPGQNIQLFLYAKASASTLAAYVVYNGVTYPSGFVAVTPTTFTKAQIYSGRVNLHDNHVDIAHIGPVTFTDGLSDAVVAALYTAGPFPAAANTGLFLPAFTPGL